MGSIPEIRTPKQGKVDANYLVLLYMGFNTISAAFYLHCFTYSYQHPKGLGPWQEGEVGNKVGLGFSMYFTIQ